MNQYSTVAKAIRRGFPIQLLFGLCALVFVLTGCGSQQSNTQNPQNTPVSLPSLQDIGQLPPGAQGAISQGTLSPNTTIQLNIGLMTNDKQLTSDLQALYNSESPDYGKFYKPADIASRYGASQDTINQVSAFLTAQGFQIVSVSKLRDSIKVKATVTQIALAFHIGLQLFQKGGETFFGPTGQFVVPASIKSLITSVQGLSNFSRPQPHLRTQTTSTPLNPADCRNAPAVYPAQIASVYDYNDVYKKGYKGSVNIGLVEFNDAVSNNDLNGFMSCTTNGGQVNGEIVQVDGGAQNPDDGSTLEATADIEYLASMAPASHIIEYQGQYCNSNSCGQNDIGFPQALYDVFETIAQDARVPVVSVSWGGPEEAFTKDDFLALDKSIQQLAAEGVTVAVAAGDCAAFDTGQFNTLAVDYPASDPFSLAVGGTSLTVKNNTQRGSEVVWSNSKPNQQDCQNSWGGGGGVSKVWKEPSYQTGSGVKNKYSDGTRQVPDVSAVADNLIVVFQGKLIGVGGTSLATPIWAAGIAMVDEGMIKNHNQILAGTKAFYIIASKYASQHPYYDITQGNNLYYPATANWDYASGWGVPNLFNFGNAVKAFSK